MRGRHPRVRGLLVAPGALAAGPGPVRGPGAGRAAFGRGCGPLTGFRVAPHLRAARTLRPGEAQRRPRGKDLRLGRLEVAGAATAHVQLDDELPEG